MLVVGGDAVCHIHFHMSRVVVSCGVRCYNEMAATMRVFAQGDENLHDILMELQVT